VLVLAARKAFARVHPSTHKRDDWTTEITIKLMISVSSRHIAGGGEKFPYRGNPPEILNSPGNFLLSVNFWTSFRHFLPMQLFFLRAFVKKKKCCRQVRFSSPKYTKMRMLPGHWGKITELSRLHSWFSGSRFAAEEGRGKGRRKRRKREWDSVPPLLFFTI